ncbi:uncharacterized protein IL334_006179 [Kwoniella shivajii]|uniref:DUF1746 domain-containing protein n=1 Tax=Kwoniella shivajii TaxID=564305 RepID=A0ABZ1D5K9_9TREE|nr:hypothetical protein IL334_006179 [Kwoniella shivajii]
MLYAPQRRHAVASLATTAHALCLLQHFHSPNLLILLARILAQIQINACAFVHPTRSLLTLTLMLILMNVTSVFLHLLDFVGGMNDGKGLVLDFVGVNPANPASLTRILLLDLLLFVIQLIGLCVSYVTHSTNLPVSSSFPYDDLLLPPSRTQNTVNISSTLFEDEVEEDDEGDVESSQSGLGTAIGLGIGRRRFRQKKGNRYESIRGDEEERELWLNDNGNHEGGQSQPCKYLFYYSDHIVITDGQHILTSYSQIRITEPPLIFSLPLRHILSLIFKLPSPLPPPRAFSGGTPISTPPITPPVVPLARMPDIVDGDLHETSSEVRREGLGLHGVGAESEEGLGRIPGEYRRENNQVG